MEIISGLGQESLHMSGSHCDVERNYLQTERSGPTSNNSRMQLTRLRNINTLIEVLYAIT